MFGVGTGLDDDVAVFGLVDVDQGKCDAVGGERFDQGGDVLGEAGALVLLIKVAYACMERFAVAWGKAAQLLLDEGVDSGCWVVGDGIIR